MALNYSILDSYTFNRIKISMMAFVIIFIALPQICISQPPSLTYLEYNYTGSGVRLSAQKNGKQVFNSPISKQRGIKHELIDMFVYNNSIVLGEIVGNSSTYLISLVSMNGEVLNTFEVKFSDKPAMPHLGDRLGDMSIDSEGNIYLKVLGKTPNEQYATQYMRKYDINGNLIWERIADEASKLDFIFNLTSLPEGTIGSVFEKRISLVFKDTKNSDESITFYSKTVPNIDYTIPAGILKYGFKESNYIHGADNNLYYLSIKKKKNKKFCFVLTNMTTKKSMDLGEMNKKPQWRYHGAVDENGNTIIQFTNKTKEKVNGKKRTLYEEKLVYYDSKGNLLKDLVLGDKSTEEKENQFPILVINGNMLYLDKDEIKWMGILNENSITLDKLNDPSLIKDIKSYWKVYPRLSESKLLFKLTRNKYAMIDSFKSKD